VTTNEPESLSPLHALVFVRLPGPDPSAFRRFLTAEPAVTTGWHVVGDIDLVLHVSCRDLPELDRLVTAMRVRGGATATSTHLVVGTTATGADPTTRPAERVESAERAERVEHAERAERVEHAGLARRRQPNPPVTAPGRRVRRQPSPEERVGAGAGR